MKIIEILAIIDLVLTNRWKETDKIMLRIVMRKLIFIVKCNRKRENKFMWKKNWSVFAAEKIM